MDEQHPAAADFSVKNLLSWEQIDALADQFERDTGRTIDRALFFEHMRCAVWSYWECRRGPFLAGRDEAHADAKRAWQAVSTNSFHIGANFSSTPTFAINSLTSTSPLIVS